MLLFSKLCIIMMNKVAFASYTGGRRSPDSPAPGSATGCKTMLNSPLVIRFDMCVLTEVCVLIYSFWRWVCFFLCFSFSFQFFTSEDFLRIAGPKVRSITISYFKKLLKIFPSVILVVTSYLNPDMCKFESPQKDENRAHSAGSSRAYRKQRLFNCCTSFYYYVLACVNLFRQGNFACACSNPRGLIGCADIISRVDVSRYTAWRPSVVGVRSAPHVVNVCCSAAMPSLRHFLLLVIRSLL